ncbi:unnamed protein product [Allacma fusca]|uniref:Tudor domain-containing protein n=1 Tax=Allacma fusca TaxID=39272 RepID=A0A8J2JXQ3_9HEXA|nr:unnamed protein product [Allacma fusca]
MTKPAQKTDLDDEDLKFYVPDDAMSPGGEIKSKGSSPAAAPAGLPKNDSLPDLKLTKENGNNNNGSKPTEAGATVTKVTASVNTLTLTPENAETLHPIYAKRDQFDHPRIGPPQGKIPRNSYYFDAIVGGIATPSNFYVRSYRTSKALEIMEKNMCDWYISKYSQNSFQIENLILYGYYVLKKDGKYIRVKIVPPFNRKGDKVMVELLDHGGFIQVEPKQLLPLRKAYLYLPTQAWKAKLHVPSWPTIIKWSPEDCARFKTEVEGKSLVALILGESIDDFTTERCLGCVLVDTSGNKDVYIHLLFNDNKK